MSEPTVNVRIGERQRELLKGAERFAYKDLDGGSSLDLHVFSPPAGEGESLPVIVFFYGAGIWERGELSQFAPQCLHFVGRGCVAVLADYRLGRERGVTPLDGVEDARDAVAWLQENAQKLKIDASKIVLAGASSGAHAALAATFGGAVEPAAMVLFSPIVNTVRDDVIEMFGDKKIAKQMSPLHQVKRDLPPSVMFHGAADRVQAVEDVEAFAKKMTKKKNVCELNVFKGERSSYFNFNVNAPLYEATLNAADDFLVRVGILDGGEADGGATTRLDSWR